MESFWPNRWGAWIRNCKASGAACQILLTMILVATVGCGPPDSENAQDYFLRVGGQMLTTRDFLQALEMAKTAYPEGAEPSSSMLPDAHRQVLEELTIDLIILNRAEEKGISVTEAELEAAVGAVKADYPPEAFEQTLAEYAVPLGPWKRRIQSRLLLEKLVHLELSGNITVQPEEVAAYYEQHYKNKAGTANPDERFQRLQETITADVRRIKLEDAFADWVETLKARYPVNVNVEQWEELTKPSAAEPPAPVPK